MGPEGGGAADRIAHAGGGMVPEVSAREKRRGMYCSMVTGPLDGYEPGREAVRPTKVKSADQAFFRT